MSKYQSAFRKAAEAKPMSDFVPNLGLGSHRVILKAVDGNETQKTQEVFIEATFVILESETEKVGIERTWPWFINSTTGNGWTGKYASSRLQEFYGVVKESVGDDREIYEIAESLTSEVGEGLGLILDVEVTSVMDKHDPSKIRTNGGGRPVRDAKWYVVEQNQEDILAARAKLAEMGSVKVAPAATAAPAPAAAASAPVANKIAGAKRLLGSK